ncbi:MAG: hypothetical protein CMJ83_00910 [Planctomycetes bacterium]|nr:hypothetical protein [Planctomycetota bacterium]
MGTPEPMLDLATWLIAFQLRAAGVLAVAALVVWVLRKRSAAVRERTWRVGLLAVVMLPILGWALPGWWPAARSWEPFAVHNDGGAGGLDAMESATSPVGGGALVATPADPGSSDTPVATAAPGREARSVPAAAASPALAVVAGWSVVGVLAVMPLFFGLLRVLRLRRTGVPASAPWIDDARSEMVRLGGGPSPRVVLAAVPVPMTWHPWPGARATVLIPADANEWTADRRRAVLRHECAHVARRDGPAQLVARALMAVLWPNPLAWWALRRLRCEAESAAGDAALTTFPRPSDYAGHLLAVACTHRPSLPLPAMAEHSTFEGRVRRILQGGCDRRAPGRGVTIAIAVLVFGGATAFAAIAPEAGGRLQEGPKQEEKTSADAVGKARARGLAWLAKNASAKGGWYGGIGYKFNAGYEVTAEGHRHVGVTALAILAFLDAGHVPGKGAHGDVLRLAVDFLCSSQVAETGMIAHSFTRMKSHGWATLCLARVQQKAPSAAVRSVLEKAVSLIVKGQAMGMGGGWRYQPFSLNADLLATVTQIRALRAAKAVGMNVPKSTLVRADAYVKSCAELKGFRYQSGDNARGSFSTSGHGAWARLAAGVTPEELDGNLERLVHDLRLVSRQFDRHYIYWHSHLGIGEAVALAAKTKGHGRHARKWRAFIRKELRGLQEKDGSWTNPVGPGSAYATAVACLLLGY